MKQTLAYIIGIIIAMIGIFGLASCSDDWTYELQPEFDSPQGNYGDRTANEETRKVLLLYSAGFNSLTSYLKEDIKDLQAGWLPSANRTDDVVLVYSHFPTQTGKYDTGSSPTLVRLYARDTTVIADTLIVYPKGTISSSAIQLNRVLTYVKDSFLAKSYGMIFSSHATGYLPAGYYQDAGSYLFDDESFKARMRRKPSPVPYIEPEYDPSLPMTKSIGQDQVGVYGSYMSHEMELPDFAEAIPMTLDYILFDACLMGGIEVAYELKDKVKVIGYSQTEVLAEGFNYKELTRHLLQNEESDPYSVCEDFFLQYDIQSGVYRSATVSMIDCTALDRLAEVCQGLFDKYNEQIKGLNPSGVQRFFRSSYHWFYDMESILINAGASEEELSHLHDALETCVLYKAHTPEFMNSFKIHTFCGFSMYLPSNGSEQLNKFYKLLKWNMDTGLVR